MRSQDPSLELALVEPLPRFAVSGNEPEVTVEAAFGDLESEAEESGDLVFECPLWALRHGGSTWTYRFHSPALGPLPYKTASFSGDFCVGSVQLHRPYVSSGTPLYPLEYPLDELLMMNLLGRGRGAEVHACGALDPQGAASLFVGQSGAGKTTISRLLQADGRSVLSDDRIIVRDTPGGGFAAYGTPWHGEAELSAASHGALSEIYFLRQGPANSVKPLLAGDATSRLLACGFVPFYDGDALRFTLDFWSKVCSHVPCRELTFVPDSTVLKCLLR